jgi:uncharacterized protein
MQYVWDAVKRQSNLIKHGFDFVDAEEVFAGPTFTYEDDRNAYGEQRWITFGSLRGIIVVIAHTENLSEIRVISMRGATKREQSTFFQNL